MLLRPITNPKSISSPSLMNRVRLLSFSGMVELKAQVVYTRPPIEIFRSGTPQSPITPLRISPTDKNLVEGLDIHALAEDGKLYHYGTKYCVYDRIGGKRRFDGFPAFYNHTLCGSEMIWGLPAHTPTLETVGFVWVSNTRSDQFPGDDPREVEVVETPICQHIPPRSSDWNHAPFGCHPVEWIIVPRISISLDQFNEAVSKLGWVQHGPASARHIPKFHAASGPCGLVLAALHHYMTYFAQDGNVYESARRAYEAILNQHLARDHNSMHHTISKQEFGISRLMEHALRAYQVAIYKNRGNINDAARVDTLILRGAFYV